MRKALNAITLLFVLMTFTGTLYSQKRIKKGVVKFDIKISENDSLKGVTFMDGATLDFYFNDSKQRTDMKMLNGMVRIQTIVSLADPSDVTLLMDMMGQKDQIIDLNKEDAGQYNSFMNMSNAEQVIYDKKDRKKIIGYSCYLAKVKTKDGSWTSYYITEKIRPPQPAYNEDVFLLNGYPLEMTIAKEGENLMTFTAKEILKLKADDFEIEEGYAKMTIKEYEKKMAELNK